MYAIVSISRGKLRTLCVQSGQCHNSVHSHSPRTTIHLDPRLQSQHPFTHRHRSPRHHTTPCHQPPQQPPPTAAKPASAANTSTANPSPPPPPPTTPPNDAYAKLSPKAKPSPPSYAPLMINSRVRLMQRTPRRSRIRAMWMMSTVMLVGVIRGFV